MQLSEEIFQLTQQHFGRAPDQCDDRQLYQALLILARQRAGERPAPTGERKLYYFSAEFCWASCCPTSCWPWGCISR